MARVTAVSLRDSARNALLAAGGRGFVRFCEQGALIVSDAIRRCESDAQRDKMIASLDRAGFDCREQDGLLLIDPKDQLLEVIAYDGDFAVDWDGKLCAVQALAVRWLNRKKQPLTAAGRQMIIGGLRLTWQDRLKDGLTHLRAQAAEMQRKGDTSGFQETGAVLADWCDRQEGKQHED